MIYFNIFLVEEDVPKQRLFQEEFVTLKQHFKPEHQNWSKMRDDFQVNIKWKFEKLNDAQKSFFFELVGLFIYFVDNYLNIANFG